MADLIPSEKSVFTSFSSKIIKSVNFRVLVPEAFSIGLVGDWEREDCLTKKDHPYEMGDKFVGIMNRKISASATNFYIFVHLLKSLGEAERALARDMEAAVGVYRAEDRIPADTLQKMNLALGAGTQTTAGSGLPPPLHSMVPPAAGLTRFAAGEPRIIVPDSLLRELSSLRISYAKLSQQYKEELQNSPEAQKVFVGTLPRLLHGPERNFQSYFDTLVEEEVSLFNVTYLKQICEIFPEDVCATTKQLVVKYEEQYQHFMGGTTLSQFKQLFPVSAVSSKLLTGKISITLKLENYWGDNTLDDLKKLVGLFGSHLHLHIEKIDVGSIIVNLLCSVTVAKELKGAIVQATKSLQTLGVLQIFIGVELVFEFPQSYRVAAGVRTKGTIETDSSGASFAAPPTTQPQSLAPTESAATVSVLGGDKSIIAAGGKGSTSAAGGKGSTIVTGGHYSQTVHHHYGQSSSQLSGGASPVVPPTTSQPQTLAPLTADEVMDQLDTVEFPLHLWRRLANGLKLGGQTSKFNEGTDNNDKLQRLITHWIDNEEHSWQQLVKAMVKCEQKIKARQLARNVGAPPE